MKGSAHPGLAIQRVTGYTLLELLIVLALLGLLVTLAMPRLITVYDSTLMALQRDEVLRAISGLGFTAYRQGREFELAHYPSPEAQAIPLDLPKGWQLSAAPSIRYRANGICTGGELELRYRSQRSVVDLRPPLCQPE